MYMGDLTRLFNYIFVVIAVAVVQSEPYKASVQPSLI